MPRSRLRTRAHHRAWLAIAACALLALPGCSPDQGEPMPSQAWWRLDPAASAPALGQAPAAPVLLRQGDGKIETLTGCSVYSAALKGPGPFEVDSGTGNPAGCEPAQMGFDARYLAILQDVTSMEATAARLTLRGDSGALAFVPAGLAATAPPPAGSAWVLQGISFNGKLRAAAPGAPAALTWDQSQVTGTTGCRDFALPLGPGPSQGSTQLDEDWEWAGDLPGLAFAIGAELEPVTGCGDPVAERQDGWLRGVWHQGVKVLWDKDALAVTHGGTTAVYRPRG